MTEPARPSPPPVPCPGRWNAYVLQGETREERRRRLAECPADLRAGVEAHVRTYFAIGARRRALATGTAA